MKYIKELSLILLTIQNASHILMMRYCRTRTTELFFTSSVIIVTEIVKLLISTVVFCYQSGIKKLYHETFNDIGDSIKVIVPAAIYVIQNNLLYVALSNLDSAVFQVSYQLKLLTTAVFSVFILKQSILKMQWLSLFLLFSGVALVQLDSASDGSKGVADGIVQNKVIGMGAVLTACVMSGFAGIYFEKTLKGSTISLWARNVLMAFIGIIISFGGQWFYEFESINEKGFFYGFDYMVCILIFLQSAGGLLVAVVVKYANQLLKGFACSASIVISILFSVFIFHTYVSGLFLVGASMVVVSIVLYSKFSPTKIKKEE
uniref:Slc35a-3 n=1 Tax=Schmidtea mediterranea TaxID=79327 RepID=A0A0H3YJH4_SCHMD|nr:slc35a-3 [Schmidtea mediterranea]